MAIKQDSTVKLDGDKCKGCIDCMRRCPTAAIRIKNEKAEVNYDKCIGCGECIRVCPNKAKRAVYDSFDAVSNFKYKIALPAPSLYGQFNNLDDINIVLTGLKRIGFDMVWEVSSGAELVSEMTRELLEKGELVRPVISSACPAVVELILIRFHNLKRHLLPLLAPVDVAAKLARREAKRVTGLNDEDIGVFFISPCPAKVYAIRDGLGMKKPIIDGVLAQSEIYFKLLPEMSKITDVEYISRSGIVGIGWAAAGGESSGMLQEKYLAADGIENCISILQELEDEKLFDLDFVELNACPAGCVGGVLNIENPFVAKAKIQALRKYMPVTMSKLKNCKMPKEELYWESEPQTVNAYQIADNRADAMKKMMEIEELLKTLPDINCAVCGAPSCRAFAEDVVANKASLSACLRRKTQVVCEEKSI